MVPSFESSHTLHFGYIDNHGISRPSALFEFMQSAATRHANELLIGADDLGIVWVLTRMKLHQSRPICMGETIRQQTFCAGAKGPNWCREFRFFSGGQQIAVAHSIWAMLDSQTRQIVRPTACEAAKPYAVRPDGFPIPGKIACGAQTPHHVHAVRYSNLDVNRHLNNARIVDLIADGLDLDRETGRFISELQVNYVSECVCGDEIALSTGFGENDTRTVLGSSNDGVKFEAEVRFSAY